MSSPVLQESQSDMPTVPAGNVPPDTTLAAYGDDGGSGESVFEQARQVAAEAQALLVDEGWHAPEPVGDADGRRARGSSPLAERQC